MKTFVREKYGDGITKSNAILDVIRKRNMVEPEKSKLVSFLQTLRTETFGSPTISSNELRTWCTERKQIPECDDDVYMLDFYIRADSTNVDDQDVKVVMSTCRLVSLCRKSSMVQADATYKLVWQGYPILIVGTSDMNNVFHPYALAITKGDTKEDFSFIFRALHEADLEWQPSILLADGSQAITNAFLAVFHVLDVRLMCSFHFHKNVETYIRPLKHVYAKIKADIYVLQTCSDRDMFEKASSLFLQKWRKENHDGVRDFLDYFEKEWLRNFPNWYEGAAPGYPSTNNGLESTNAIIKKEQTLRERLPLNQFLAGAVNLVGKWLRRCNPTSINCAEFATTRSISLQLWICACQWATSNVPVLQREMDDCTEYFISPSEADTPITARMLAKFERRTGKWTNFDDFKTWHREIWKVAVYPTHHTCTCPTFVKRQQCKHGVGMQIRRKEVVVPLEAKNVPLGQKRKRGRPSKAKKALLI